MNTYDIIKQITKQLTEKQLPNERIPFLCPIDFIVDSSDPKKAKETSEISCMIPPERFKKTDSLKLNHVIIRDRVLYEKLHQELREKTTFIKYLNIELFKYIQSQFSDLKKLGVMDSDNIWYQPKKRFSNWFSLKNIDPTLKGLRTKNTDDISSKKVVETKRASIPIMITNKMRIELKTLGYSKEEMKELTPQSANLIIKKGIPKTPSKDRNRNQ